MEKIAIIVCGASGSGKSRFSELIRSFNPDDSAICAADDYFVVQGEYNFDPKRLGDAHRYCQTKFKGCCEMGVSIVIVANTSTRFKDRELYYNIAKENGYTVYSIGMENLNGTKDIHNVPDETLARQKNQLRNSFIF